MVDIKNKHTFGDFYVVTMLICININIMNKRITSFVAIDFETVAGICTVNNKKYIRLPCAVGLVKYVNGIEMQKYYTLLNPKCEGNWKCIKGDITPNMVMDAPTLSEVFDDILRIKKELPVVAHNASCEDETLKTFYDIYGNIGYGEEISSFYDTLSLLKNLKETDNELFVACVRHGIQTGIAHDALNDAEACARLFLKLQGVEPVIQKPRGFVPMDKNIVRHKRRDADYMKSCPEEDVSNISNPFYRQNVLFTGEFDFIERDELLKKLYYLGANNKSSVANSLNIAIVGHKPGPSKMEKIYKMINQGANLRIINIDELQEILKQYE